MTAEHGEIGDPLDKTLRILAEGQISLHKLIAELATETRRGFDSLQKRSEETDRRMRETDERMKRTDDRMRATDERIGKLVSAIGEFIRKS
jgi:chromosome condensin MukBEF complex kleisin-like MukF subunit